MKTLSCEILSDRNRFSLAGESFEIPWIRAERFAGTKQELVFHKDALIWAIAQKFKEGVEEIVMLRDGQGYGWTIPAIVSDITGESAKPSELFAVADLFARLMVSTAEVDEIGLMLEDNVITSKQMEQLRAKWLDWSYYLLAFFNWDHGAMVKLMRFLQLAFDNWIGIGDEANKMKVDLSRLVEMNEAAANLWSFLNEEIE